MVISKQKKISIIIPNLDGYNFLVGCLASLKQQSCQDFELILVDNGSNDQSIVLTKEQFPQTVVHRFNRNEGFSRAVNRGISLANGQYVMLLNNDTELDIDCLKNLNNFLDDNPQVAFAATKMLYLNDKEIINDVGDIFSIYGLAHQRGNKEKDQGQYDEVGPVFGACAGGAIYRRELFAKVGLFDESFFAYLEDLDFSFRAQSLGYVCYYVPQAIIYHFDGGTSRKRKHLTHFLTIRNGLYLVFKNFPLSWLIIFSPFLLINQMRNIISGLKHGYLLLVCKAYANFIVNIPQLYKKRQIIQRGRQVSKKYLLSIISKKYPFSIKTHLYGIFHHNR